MKKRIGFACKYKAEELNLKKKEIKEIESSYNTKTTTVKHMKTLSDEDAYNKMKFILTHNMESTFKLLEYTSNLEDNLKMLRLSSDLLPFYTHEITKNIYKDTEILSIIENGLKKIGDLARNKDVRLSMHPGQFCVLASDKESVVKNSIDEFEYHVEMIKMMGFGKKFQDFKCNVHISGAQGSEGIRRTLSKMSPEARNVITIENEEFKWGLDECLKLKDICPIVLDLHHIWINEGKRIDINDNRIKLILESWRDVRGVIHYSQSKENLFDIKKDFNKELVVSDLLDNGYNKKSLCAHSDMMWNHNMNIYAKDFNEEFDIMVEAKNKNLASINLNEIFKKL